MKRSVKIWAIIFSVISVVFVGVVLMKKELDNFDSYPTGSPLNEDSLKFNSEEWKKERVYYEEIRPYMLKDLTTKILKIGMDSTTVKELLGKTWGVSDSRFWLYRLGVYREMEASYLQIEFEENGKVKSIKIIDR